MAGIIKIVAVTWILAGLIGITTTLSGCEVYGGVRPMDSHEQISRMTTSPWKCIFTSCSKESKSDDK